MTGLGALIRRNSKLYFKDKGMFFTSLITPMILLVLYVTFLSRTYEGSFRSALAAARGTRWRTRSCMAVSAGSSSRRCWPSAV